MSRGHGSLALAGRAGRHMCNTVCSTVCNADARDAALAWRWRAIACVPSARAWWARGDWQRTGSVVGRAPARRSDDHARRHEDRARGPVMRRRALWWHAGLGSAARGGWASGTRAGRLRTSSVGFGPPARTSVDQAPQLERRRPGRGRANVMRASGAQRAKRGGAGPGPAGSGQTERARAAHGLHAVRGLRARGLRRAGCGACAAAHLCFAERSSCRCALSERTPPRRQPAAVAQYAGGVAPFAPSSPSR